ncbi:uncharacterized protein LOC116299866 [Actinia tenebrosa]|uniref:Uncharacterized protein LOC116299866 n=1 Tax=Actinia tenebrosa TaxID=6105 RepID=A0A6P8I8Q5_ACTTE|nr:uncharacterized protein LOC116299866 [Actinia tenebrosa]
MKLICAGLSKTGTTSIAHALRILGYKVCRCHDQILYYMDEWLDLYKHGKVPDFYAMFKDVDVVIGSPCNFFFEELMEAFPDAKVILSIRRDENAWIKSFKNHFAVLNNSYLTKMQCLLPTYKNLLCILTYALMSTVGTPEPNSSYICRKRYRWHNDRVKSLVPADKLLVYSVEQGWEPLCEFTGQKIPDQPFPHLNIKGEIQLTFETETELGRKIAREVRVVKVCCVAVMVALIGVVLIYLFTLF